MSNTALEQKSKRRIYLALVPLSCAIPIAAFFGRAIERHYPFLIYLIPYSFFLLFLFHATSLARKLVRTTTKNYLLIVGLLSAPFLCTAISGLLVDLPIERIHIVKYGLLSFTLSLFFKPKYGPRRFWLAFLLAAAIGIAEESSQYWIPDRRFDPRDLLLNVASVCFGVYYAWLISIVPKKSVREKGSGDAAVDDLK